MLKKIFEWGMDVFETTRVNDSGIVEDESTNGEAVLDSDAATSTKTEKDGRWLDERNGTRNGAAVQEHGKSLSVNFERWNLIKFKFNFLIN